jgi:hypothetical protein
MGLATGYFGALRASQSVAVSDVDWKVRSGLQHRKRASSVGNVNATRYENRPV